MPESSASNVPGCIARSAPSMMATSRARHPDVTSRRVRPDGRHPDAGVRCSMVLKYRPTGPCATARSPASPRPMACLGWSRAPGHSAAATASCASRPTGATGPFASIARGRRWPGWKACIAFRPPAGARDARLPDRCEQRGVRRGRQGEEVTSRFLERSDGIETQILRRLLKQESVTKERFQPTVLAGRKKPSFVRHVANPSG